MKYAAYITYSERRYIEVEAEDEEEAKEIAMSMSDEAEPMGDDDYSIEVEEIDE